MIDFVIILMRNQFLLNLLLLKYLYSIKILSVCYDHILDFKFFYNILKSWLHVHLIFLLFQIIQNNISYDQFFDFKFYDILNFLKSFNHIFTISDYSNSNKNLLSNY